MSNANRKQVKALTINGTVFRVRYTFQKDNGSFWHVLDIGDLDYGPGQGTYGDEIPA